MPNACPIPTPAEREYGAILDRIEEDLMRKVGNALAEAAERSRVETAELAVQPPPYRYFAAVVHQHMYCTLCGADPKTFAGGRADTAVAVIRNAQKIAERYWGAKINTICTASDGEVSGE